MVSRKIMSMISLAKKAGVLRTGDFAVSYSIQEKKSKLVIVAKDASINTKKKFVNKGDYYGIPIEVYGDKVFFSWATGKDNVTIISVEEENFASQILNLITENN